MTNRREQIFIITILLTIIGIVSVDLFTDFNQGVRWWHVFMEASAAIAALIGLFLLIRSSFNLKHSLAEEKELSSKLLHEAEKWRAQAKKHVDGLSETIDTQLTEWKLTLAEKEIVFLLLKGLSLKEIAEIRQTTEKTTRAQSTSIYAKAGLSSRSELSAFFLEDLLPPKREVGTR